jgi:hypothetical protein
MDFLQAARAALASRDAALAQLRSEALLLRRRSSSEAAAPPQQQLPSSFSEAAALRYSCTTPSWDGAASRPGTPAASAALAAENERLQVRTSLLLSLPVNDTQFQCRRGGIACTGRAAGDGGGPGAAVRRAGRAARRHGGPRAAAAHWLPPR